MKVAVVGSRSFAPLSRVSSWVQLLLSKHPDAIVVSGGARGVDTAAEQAALQAGGRVLSFRPVEIQTEGWGIDLWQLGGPESRIQRVLGPFWADFAGAAAHRNSLIAECCEKWVGFWDGRSHGTILCRDFAHAYGRDVHTFV